MRSALLQKLLNKKKQEKFGEVVQKDNWEVVVPNILEGVSKFDDVIVPIKEQGKVIAMLQYITTTQKPTTQIIQLIMQILSVIDSSEDISKAADLLRDMTLNSGSQASSIIDLIVRNFLKQTESQFSNCINQIINASSNFIPYVSASITKFYPQTNFDYSEQINYLRLTLEVCSFSNDVAVNVLGRVFQHICGLDCELMISTSKGESNEMEIDEDVALVLTPQILLILDFIEKSTSDVFTLILQLFNLYLIDLPSSTAVQFILFIAASYDRDQCETFVGYLLHKIIENGVCLRTKGNAAFYLSTLIARAKYIDDQLAAATITYVVNFASCYIKHVKTTSPEMMTRNTKVHAIFYYALQCIAYACCWRYDSWKKSGLDPEEKWHLSELFDNSFRGMSAIDKNTAEMFASLGIVDYDSSEVIIDRIKVWFPFDPCPLEEIQAKVLPIYRSWGEDTDSVDIESKLDQSLNKICLSRGISFDDILKDL